MKQCTGAAVSACLVAFTFTFVAAQLPPGPHVNIDLRTGVTVPPSLVAGMTWVTPVPLAVPSNRRCNLQGVLKLTFGPKTGRRAEINLEYEVPQGWTFHAADSATNDGYAGDGSTQSNDAEVHVTGSTIFFYGRDNVAAGGTWGQLHRNNAYVNNRGRITINVSDGKVTADNMSESIYVQSYRTVALSGQPDTQGAVNTDLYIGLNRVVRGRRDRTGSGLCRVYLTWHEQ